mmetsp:Transcript_8804/g.16656  ORF Transcript_8804/g.16656 Transcript_8804/m.16656 type:complete len:244 (-) Transcript_8804:21859-22590(-)
MPVRADRMRSGGILSAFRAIFTFWSRLDSTSFTVVLDPPPPPFFFFLPTLRSANCSSKLSVSKVPNGRFLLISTHTLPGRSLMGTFDQCSLFIFTFGLSSCGCFRLSSFKILSSTDSCGAINNMPGGGGGTPGGSAMPAPGGGGIMPGGGGTPPAPGGGGMLAIAPGGGGGTAPDPGGGGTAKAADDSIAGCAGFGFAEAAAFGFVFFFFASAFDGASSLSLSESLFSLLSSIDDLCLAALMR